MTDLRAQLQTSLGDAYTIERELGGGGMSRVFLTRDNTLGRPVVVKLLLPELSAGVSAERFTREVKLAASLQQANIVPLLIAGDSAGLPYYTMPFVDGQSLRARLGTGEAMPIRDVVSIMRDVARALAYAHDKGIVHRDIKPENILISGHAAVVTDFGIAKALADSRTNPDIPQLRDTDAQLTQAGISLGTPAYMSPEQALGDPAANHRADIYALGCVAYEMLTGAPPFGNRPPHKLVTAHITEMPAPVASRRADIPPGLAQLVMRCLEKAPASRPQSAREVLEALDATTTPSGVRDSAVAPRPVRRIGVAVVAVAIAALAIYALVTRARGVTTTEPSAMNSVAVLPFENVGGDTANAYFADGVTDELITALSKLPGLRVAGRSSSFRFRGQGANGQAAGRALNVSTLLEGSVRRAGNAMRISAQLTRVSDGSVVWSEKYDRKLTDVFALQDEITKAIASALEGRLASSAGAAPGPAAAPRSANAEAHDLYLRGLYFLQRRGAGIRRSIGYFEQAIAKDSSYPPAYAQLASALALLPLYENVSADSVRARAQANAERALALDSLNAEAHAALGITREEALDRSGAAREYDRAIALNPNYTFTHLLYASVLWDQGRIADALEQTARGIETDPVSPIAVALRAKALIMARRYGEGLVVGRRALELDSSAAVSRASVAIAEFYLGHRDEARRIAFAFPATPNAVGWMTFVLASTDGPGGAIARAHALEQQRGANGFIESTAALAYIAGGDTSRALDALERAARARELISFAGGLSDPGYDAVRKSARFAALARAFGLDPAAVTTIDTGRVK